MNELLHAAKAVIDNWHCVSHARLGYYVEELRDAVERAEKPPADFEKWFKGRLSPTYYETWQAAQQAERERIRGEIQELKANCSDDGAWRECCDEILEMIDE